MIVSKFHNWESKAGDYKAKPSIYSAKDKKVFRIKRTLKENKALLIMMMSYLLYLLMSEIALL